jgi:hypothetical protein
MTHPFLAFLYKHGWLPDRRAVRRLETEAAWIEGYRAAMREMQESMGKEATQ